MRQPYPPVSLEPGPGPGPDRLRLRPDPLRLAFSRSPWLSAWFLLSYLIVAPVLFCVVVAVCVTAAALSVTIALMPVLIAAAAVTRACADVQRAMLGQVLPGRIRGAYPPAGGPGLWQRARARWSSGATWRDLACLGGLFVPFVALDALVLGSWLALLAGAALPLWFRHAYDVCLGDCTAQHIQGIMIGYFPHGPAAASANGYYIDSVHSALIVAALCLAAFLLFSYVLVVTARMQARVMRAVLRRPADPLAPARHVLAGPGPLGPLVR
jgi:Putative sensor